MKAVDAIMKLNKIFKSKNWVEKDHDEFVFDQFCKLFNNLDNDEERKLIIELTENYTWISFTEYQGKILNSLKLVEDEKLEQLKKIYFFPIIKPEDEGKIKSGPYLLYPLKSYKKFLPRYSHIKFEIITSFDTMKKENFEIKDNEQIFLMDDYIGSGETLTTCIEHLKSNNDFTNENFSIVSIATQKEIYDKTMLEGISYYCDTIKNKGITDNYVDPELSSNINLMKDLENMIPGGSHFSFGYNDSEGLITLIRTPDNTFPIFWKEYRKGRDKFKAPFSRDESVYNA